MTTVEVKLTQAVMKLKESHTLPSLDDVRPVQDQPRSFSINFKTDVNQKHVDLVKTLPEIQVDGYQYGHVWVTVPETWVADAQPTASIQMSTPVIPDLPKPIEQRIKEAFAGAHGGKQKDIASVHALTSAATLEREYALVSRNPINKDAAFAAHGLTRVLFTSSTRMTFVIPAEWVSTSDPALLSPADPDDTDELPKPFVSLVDEMIALKAELASLKEAHAIALAANIGMRSDLDTARTEAARLHGVDMELHAVRDELDDLRTKNDRLLSGNWTLLRVSDWNHLCEQNVQLVRERDALTTQAQRYDTLLNRQGSLLNRELRDERHLETQIIMLPPSGSGDKASFNLDKLNEARQQGWRVVYEQIVTGERGQLQYVVRMDKPIVPPLELARKDPFADHIETALDLSPIDDGAPTMNPLDEALRPELEAAHAAGVFVVEWEQGTRAMLAGGRRD